MSEEEKSQSLSDEEQIEAFKAKRVDWMFDPLLFFRECLGMYICKCQKGDPCELDDNQEEIILSLCALILAKSKQGKGIDLSEIEEELYRKIGMSVQAGKGVGKTAIAALIVIWFFICFKDAKVVLLGPNYNQIKTRLWSEICLWLGHAEKVYGENNIINLYVEKQADKIYMKGVGKMEEKDRWVILIQTFPKNADIEQQKIEVQGHHAQNLLFVLDEASGVRDHIFEAIETTLVDPVNLVFAIYNPNRNVGWAIESQRKMQSRWLTMRINAETSRRVKKDQIEYMAFKYGKNSNKYRVSVLGLPPVSDAGALIPFEWISEAQQKSFTHPVNPAEPIVFGIDIGGGGGGDVSVICVRQGWHIREFLVSNIVNTDTVCNWIIRMIEEYKPIRSYIDMNAIGRQAYFRIKGFGHNIKGIHSQNSSTVKDDFYRIRDELYWRMRTAFEDGLIIICADERGRFDDDFEGELSLITYDDQGTDGKTKITSKQNSAFKKEMQSLLGYDSPNKTDSATLTMFHTMDQINRAAKKTDEFERPAVKKRQFKGKDAWMLL